MVIVFPESGGVYVQPAVALVPVDGLTATAAQAVVVELPMVALKVTVPVGTGDRVPVMVAPNVIAAPVAEGLADEVTATVEAPVELTTMVAELAKPAGARGNRCVGCIARIGGHQRVGPPGRRVGTRGLAGRLVDSHRAAREGGAVVGETDRAPRLRGAGQLCGERGAAPDGQWALGRGEGEGGR